MKIQVDWKRLVPFLLYSEALLITGSPTFWESFTVPTTGLSESAESLKNCSTWARSAAVAKTN